MAGVNTDGTYRLTNAELTIDTGGTPITLKIAATSMALIAEPNYASHARTGAAPPREQFIDAQYTLELAYGQGFGTDGIQTAFASLEGTEVDWLLETTDGAVSATAPTFTFTATVPAIDPLPSTEMGEFAMGEVSIPVNGVPVKVIV